MNQLNALSNRVQYCAQNQWSAQNWGVVNDAAEERFNWRYR